MKRVAIFNTCISGSTGKIAVALHRTLLKKGYTSFFFYGRKDGETGTNYYTIGNRLSQLIHIAIARFLGLQGFGSFFATRRVLSFMTEQRIDTVIIVSPHGYYLNEKQLLKYIATNKIKTVYIMVDEYAFLGKCGYSTYCKNYLSGCHHCPKIRQYPKSFFVNGAPHIYKMKERAYKEIDRITFVGPAYTVSQAQKSPLLCGKQIEVVDEAINTDFYTPRNTQSLREKLGIKQDSIVLVCIAPYSNERKGCKYYVDLAKRFEGDPRFIFVHVGFDVPFEKVNIPSNYLPIGFITDQDELASYYSLGDLFVFLSISDTMPNTCLEALSAGTPLLCFNTSGMPYIADETVATFVEVADVNALEKVIENTNKKTTVDIKRCRDYALSRYDEKEYHEKIIEIVNRME